VRVSSLASALKESNGAITGNVRATVAQTLADAKLEDNKTSLLKTMNKAGVSLKQLTDAYLGNGGGIDALRAKMSGLAEMNVEFVSSGGAAAKSYTDQGMLYKRAADALGPLNGEYSSGINLAKQMAEAMDGGSSAMSAAADPAGRLKSLVKLLGDSEASADDKARALHQSLLILAGGSLDVQAAVAQQNAAILDLGHAFDDSTDRAKGFGKALLNADGSINTATENGQELFTKLESIAEQTSAAAEATYKYARANNESVPDALKAAEGAMQSSWDAIVGTGQKLGLTKDQAEALAVQMGMIPGNLAITLAVKDLPPTQQAMLYVQSLADHLKEGAVVKVGALPDEALKALKDVGIKTKSLPDGHVEITVPTKEVLAKLNEINNKQINDKYFNVTASFRSRFLDAGAQFADGGTTKFADGGVLHAADGLTVPGYAPRRDTVRALLSPGEGVLVPEAVRQIGGAPAIDAINRGARTGRLVTPVPSRPAATGRPTGHAVITNHFHIAGSVLTERDLRDVVEQQMLRLGMRGSTTWQPYERR
jgi:hypothetical protein